MNFLLLVLVEELGEITICQIFEIEFSQQISVLRIAASEKVGLRKWSVKKISQKKIGYTGIYTKTKKCNKHTPDWGYE